MSILTYKVCKPLFLLIVLAMLISCESNFKEIQKINQKGFNPTGEAINLNLKYTDSGKIKAVLLSPKMLDFSNLDFQFNEFPKGIDLTIYQDAINTTRVTSKYAVVYKSTNIIDLRGKVVIKTSKGQLMETEQLYYDQKSEWFFTEKKFKFTDAKGSSIGQGIDFSKDFKVISTQRVSGEVDSESEL